MANGNNNSTTSDVWKWATTALASFLAGLLIAGVPFVIRTPTKDEFDVVRERQQVVLQRLERIEERLQNHAEDDMDVHRRLDALERLLTEIINSGT